MKIKFSEPALVTVTIFYLIKLDEILLHMSRYIICNFSLSSIGLTRHKKLR